MKSYQPQTHELRVVRADIAEFYDPLGELVRVLGCWGGEMVGEGFCGFIVCLLACLVGFGFLFLIPADVPEEIIFSLEHIS